MNNLAVNNQSIIDSNGVALTFTTATFSPDNGNELLNLALSGESGAVRPRAGFVQRRLRASAQQFAQRVNSSLSVPNITLSNGVALDFDGTATLTASTMSFPDNGAAGRIYIEGGTNLTLPVGTTLQGKIGNVGNTLLVSGTNNLINNGAIISDVSGHQTTLTTTTLTNSGAMWAHNGTSLYVSGAVSSSCRKQVRLFHCLAKCQREDNVRRGPGTGRVGIPAGGYERTGRICRLA